MSIALRGTPSYVYANATSVTLSAPAGFTTGDVLVAFIADYGTSGVQTTAPTGWAQCGGDGASTGRVQLFTAANGLNGLTGTSWTWSGLTTRCMGGIIGYSGCNIYAPASASSVRSNASGTTGSATITPAFANSQILAGFVTLKNPYTFSAEACATNPATLTEQGTEYSDGTYFDMVFADGAQTTAAATGASSATMSTAFANGACLIAISPATASPLPVNANLNFGYVQNQGTVYATVQSASSGIAATTTGATARVTSAFSTPTYTLDRMFAEIPLTGVSGTVTAFTLAFTLAGAVAETSQLCLFAGTQAEPLTTSDYISFTGVELATRVTPPTAAGGTATFTLNASGLSYVNSVGTGNAKFCVRVAYDVDNSAPSTNYVPLYSSANGIAAYRPLATVTYSSATAPTVTDSATANADIVTVAIQATVTRTMSVADMATANADSVTVQVVAVPTRTMSATDTATANADAVTVRPCTNISVTDTATGSDSVAILKANLALSISDTATANADVSTARLCTNASVSDTATGADSVTVNVNATATPAISKTDTATANADAVTVSVQATATPVVSHTDVATANADSVTVSVQPATTLAISKSDTAIASADSATVQVELEAALLVAVSDSASANDAVAVFLPALTVSVSDAGTASDSVTLLLPELRPSASDVGSAADSASVVVQGTTTLLTSVSDSATASDAATVGIQPTNTLLVSVSDSSTATDSAVVSVQPTTTLVISAIDTVTASDSTTAAVQPTSTPQISVADIAIATDAPQVSITLYVSVSDVATATDSVNVAQRLLLSGSDTGSATDGVSVGIPLGISSIDTSTTTDSLVIYEPWLILTTGDIANATDAVNVWIVVERFIGTLQGMRPSTVPEVTTASTVMPGETSTTTEVGRTDVEAKQ